MARLIYSAIASLDGYVADRSGSFAWAAPDEEVHAFVNGLERPLGTYLYGRRMYETMACWETMAVEDQPPVVQDFAAIWRAADKVVFSRSKTVPVTARTTLRSAFEPAAIRALKRAAERDLSVGGPTLAALAIRAGLVDECNLFLNPLSVGGGIPALPGDVRVRLDLVDERRFSCGVVHLRYLVTGTEEG